MVLAHLTAAVASYVQHRPPEGLAIIGGETAFDLPDPSAGPEECALRLEQARCLQAALLTLAPDQRLSVILSDVQGLSYEEVSQAMGSSLGTVKSRISRGRARLRRDLLERGELSLPGQRPIQ